MKLVKNIKKAICYLKGHESSKMFALNTGKKWCIKCGESL